MNFGIASITEPVINVIIYWRSNIEIDVHTHIIPEKIPDFSKSLAMKVCNIGK